MLSTQFINNLNQQPEVVSFMEADMARQIGSFQGHESELLQFSNNGSGEKGVIIRPIFYQSTTS